MGNSFSQPKKKVSNFLRRKFAAISCWPRTERLDRPDVDQPSAVHKFKPVRLTREQQQLLNVYFERRSADIDEFADDVIEAELRELESPSEFDEDDYDFEDVGYVAYAATPETTKLAKKKSRRVTFADEVFSRQKDHIDIRTEHGNQFHQEIPDAKKVSTEGEIGCANAKRMDEKVCLNGDGNGESFMAVITVIANEIADAKKYHIKNDTFDVKETEADMEQYHEVYEKKHSYVISKENDIIENGIDKKLCRKNDENNEPMDIAGILNEIADEQNETYLKDEASEVKDNETDKEACLEVDEKKESMDAAIAEILVEIANERKESHIEDGAGEGKEKPLMAVCREVDAKKDLFGKAIAEYSGEAPDAKILFNKHDASAVRNIETDTEVCLGIGGNETLGFIDHGVEEDPDKKKTVVEREESEVKKNERGEEVCRGVAEKKECLSDVMSKILGKDSDTNTIADVMATTTHKKEYMIVKKNEHIVEMINNKSFTEKYIDDVRAGSTDSMDYLSVDENVYDLDETIDDILELFSKENVVQKEDDTHNSKANNSLKEVCRRNEDDKESLDDVIADILEDTPNADKAESVVFTSLKNSIELEKQQNTSIKLVNEGKGTLHNYINKNPAAMKGYNEDSKTNMKADDTGKMSQMEVENKKGTIDDIIADILDETSDTLAVSKAVSKIKCKESEDIERLQKCNKKVIYTTNRAYLRREVSGDAKTINDSNIKDVLVREKTEGDEEKERTVMHGEEVSETSGTMAWSKFSEKFKALMDKRSASEVVKPGCRMEQDNTPKECVHFSRTMTKTRMEGTTFELLKKAKLRPCPEKGIRWPSVTDGLSRETLAYYVENFLCSQLFKTRVSRKVRGSSTWMNGLSQFQIWVIEHDNTQELDELLRPIKARKTNTKAKVNCWQEMTSRKPRNPD